MSTKEVEWDGIPVPRRYWAILAIAMGITVSVLDGTIANVALPSIAEDLNATPSMSIWIVNAYQLAIVVSLLSLSSLGDIWGYKRVYIAGLLIFSVTSLACALSTSLTQLTVARVFQGFGAAALASVNTTLIRMIYPVVSGAGIGNQCLGRCRFRCRGTDDCRRDSFHRYLAMAVCHKHPDRDCRFGTVVQVLALQPGESHGTHVRLAKRYHECIDLRVIDLLDRGIHARCRLGGTHPDDRGGVRDRLFFRAAAVVTNLPVVACRFVTHPDILPFRGNLHLLVCSPDAGNGIPAFLLAAHVGKERGCYRNITYPLALGDHGGGSPRGKADRTGTRRFVRRHRFVDIHGRLVPACHAGG